MTLDQMPFDVLVTPIFP